MAMQNISYQDARKRMKPGDVIAFSGKGHFSEIIKWATFSSVSHVGVILQSQLREDDTDRFFNQIIESTSLNGFSGVMASRFSDRLSAYEGDIWWLPLATDMRKDKSMHKRFFDFLFRQAEDAIPYDMPQAVKSAIDALDDLPFGKHGPMYNGEDFSRFFCSELVAAGLEAAEVVTTVNASEVTPADLCSWNIYEDDYYLLKSDDDSDAKNIKNFNKVDPSNWNTQNVPAYQVMTGGTHDVPGEAGYKQ